MERIKDEQIAGALFFLMEGGIDSPLLLGKLLGVDARHLAKVAEHTRRWFDDFGKTWVAYKIPHGNVVCGHCSAVCTTVPCQYCQGKPDWIPRFSMFLTLHGRPANSPRDITEGEDVYEGQPMTYLDCQEREEEETT